VISFSNIINLDIRTKFDFEIEKYVKDFFEIESNYISCTIPFEQEVIYQIDNKNVGLNKTEKKVIELLIEDQSFTSIELSVKIGVTKRTVESTFKSLQEKKMIERIGSKCDGN
jgi:putative ATP-dependent DNA helicase